MKNYHKHEVKIYQLKNSDALECCNHNVGTSLTTTFAQSSSRT